MSTSMRSRTSGKRLAAINGASSVRKFELSGEGPYTLALESSTTFLTPNFAAHSSTRVVPSTLNEW